MNLDCFSVEKLLCYYPVVKDAIVNGNYDQIFPLHITLDFTTHCNLRCWWCNSKVVPNSLNPDVAASIPRDLHAWHNKMKYAGVITPGICIAGGEPTLYPGFSNVVGQLNENFNVGVITNGTKSFADKIPSLTDCVFVGVSVDAATEESYSRNKEGGKNWSFNVVLDNIQNLTDYVRSRKCKMNCGIKGYGVAFKFLVTPYNVGEMFDACRLADKLGCHVFQARPYDSEPGRCDTPIDVEEYRRQQALIEALKTKMLVKVMDHNFDPITLNKQQSEHCHVSCFWLRISPGSVGGLQYGLCVDRLGFEPLIIARDISITEFADTVWGKEAHLNTVKRFNDLKLYETCPRCSRYTFNEMVTNYLVREPNELLPAMI